MSIKNITVTEMKMNFPSINLELKNNDFRKYELVVLMLDIIELERGFKVKRINKTTKKGTSVIFESFDSEVKVKKYIDNFKIKLEEYNKKYDTNMSFDLDIKS